MTWEVSKLAMRREEGLLNGTSLAKVCFSSSFKTHHCQVNAFQLSCWFLFTLLAANQRRLVEDHTLFFRTDLLHTHTVSHIYSWKLDDRTTVWFVVHWVVRFLFRTCSLMTRQSWTGEPRTGFVHLSIVSYFPLIISFSARMASGSVIIEAVSFTDILKRIVLSFQTFVRCAPD